LAVQERRPEEVQSMITIIDRFNKDSEDTVYPKRAVLTIIKEIMKISYAEGYNDGTEYAIGIDDEKWFTALRDLKYETDDLYRQLGKLNVWAATNEEVCDMCEVLVKKHINEVFEHLMPKVKK
jgi:hypothetical protein